MNRLLLAALLSAVAGAGVAAAQNPAPAPANKPMRADANGDGGVSRAEFIAGAGRRFDAMDTNKDGTLSRDERRAWHETHRAMLHGGPEGAGVAPPPPGEAPPPPGGGFGGPGAGLRLLDRDGDGKITRAEYDAPFAQLDANRDGFVDASERAAAPQGGARLARLDRDGDGKLSRAEYETPFDRLDANRDGVIDASELAAVRGRFGGRFGGRRGGFAPPPPAEGE